MLVAAVLAQHLPALIALFAAAVFCRSAFQAQERATAQALAHDRDVGAAATADLRRRVAAAGGSPEDVLTFGSLQAGVGRDAREARDEFEHCRRWRAVSETRRAVSSRTNTERFI